MIKVLRFFQKQDGDIELWNMISIMNGGGPSEETDSSRVLHISDITTAY